MEVVLKSKSISKVFRYLLNTFEVILALVIFFGAVIFAYNSLVYFMVVDWKQAESIYELIYRVFLIAISLELIRTLILHDLKTILELLAFVVARKMLKPDLSALDIFLSVLSFAVLLLCSRYLFENQKNSNNK